LIDTYGLSGFLAAAHIAYDRHLPLEISPDVVWTTIMESICKHVNTDPEKYRSIMVSFEGKEKISVAVDHFSLPPQSNDWTDALNLFSAEMTKKLGKDAENFLCNFSTSTRDSFAASQILLMGAYQHFFEYECTTMCGIPKVHLRGTIDDWNSIRKRLVALKKFNTIVHWIDNIECIINQIVESIEGKHNMTFWNNMVKVHGASGGPYVSGWIIAFFLYENGPQLKINKYLKKWNPKTFCFDGMNSCFACPKTRNMPAYHCSVPVTWDYIGTIIPLKFHSSLNKVSMDPKSYVVKAEPSWWITPDNDVKEGEFSDK
jgi:hypothetical protein